MSKPAIRIRRTREVRDREDRFLMVKLAKLLTEKWDSPKLQWTLNCAHPFDYWTTELATEGDTFLIKLDMALHEDASMEAPHQWRLTVIEVGRYRWPVLDPLVGHEALDPLVEALKEKGREVSELIQRMLDELESMGKAA